MLLSVAGLVAGVVGYTIWTINDNRPVDYIGTAIIFAIVSGVFNLMALIDSALVTYLASGFLAGSFIPYVYGIPPRQFWLWISIHLYFILVIVLNNWTSLFS